MLGNCLKLLFFFLIIYAALHFQDLHAEPGSILCFAGPGCGYHLCAADCVYVYMCEATQVIACVCVSAASSTCSSCSLLLQPDSLLVTF